MSRAGWPSAKRRRGEKGARAHALPCVQRRPTPFRPRNPSLAVLQAWLASRGPLLQQMAVQQHLWGEVAAAVQVGGRRSTPASNACQPSGFFCSANRATCLASPARPQLSAHSHCCASQNQPCRASHALQPADSASPLHAAMVESAFATVQAASQQVGAPCRFAVLCWTASTVPIASPCSPCVALLAHSTPRCAGVGRPHAGPVPAVPRKAPKARRGIPASAQQQRRCPRQRQRQPRWQRPALQRGSPAARLDAAVVQPASGL